MTAITNTTFIQPIFGPNKYLWERNKASLRSVLSYFKKYDYNVPIFLGGFLKNEFMDEFKSILGETPNTFWYLFIENLGKAIVVNNLMNAAANNKSLNKYILTCDSDIIFREDESNIIERMEHIAEESEKHRNIPFGLCAFDYLDDDLNPITPHFQEVYSNSYIVNNSTYSKDEIINYHSGVGIAGGALFISTEAIRQFRGYRPLGVYASDDAFLMKDMILSGKSIQVCSNMKVIHPKDLNEKYAEWKSVQIGWKDPSTNNIFNGYDRNFTIAKAFFEEEFKDE